MTHGGESALVVIVVATISSCVIGFRMRRKIRRVLGRKATDTDLASIATWMKVDEEEDKASLNPK
jgi:carbamate kinase